MGNKVCRLVCRAKVLCSVSLLCLVGYADTLEVGASGATIVGSTVEYENIVLHGNYVIGADASVTNVGNLLDIGPNVGDDATFTVKDGGQYVGVGEQQRSNRRMVIGRNGGKGKIVVSDVEPRDKPSWTSNTSRFSAEEWNLALSDNADASSETMDIVRIDTNAFFSIWCVSNYNTSVRARLLFNGGTYYMKHRCSIPFNPVIGSEIVLEAMEGNDIRLLRKAGQCYPLVGYSKASGLLRFCGEGDVVLEGAAGEGPGSTIRPGFIVTECCRFEQTGNLVVAGTMLLSVDSQDSLPYGPETGSLVLQDEDTELRVTRGNRHALNALLGCGSVSNALSTGSLAFIFSNDTDRVLSEMISPELTWLDSVGGIKCVKYGSGSLLADSTPSVPLLSIAQGSVCVTADATADSMKGRTVEFGAGTSLHVDAGRWSPERTVLHPQSSVSISDGATYRTTGDGYLVGASVAQGGTIEKAGDGTLTIYESDAAFSGRLRVLGGTVRFSARGDVNDFWRLTIRQSSGMSNPQKRYVNQLACIGLFSASDTENSIGRTDTVEATPGTPAHLLSPGSITIPAGVNWNASSSSDSRLATLAGLLDSKSRYASYTFPDAVAELDDETTWLPITIRLKEDHAPVDSFRLIYGWLDTDWCAQAWTLESSPSGLDGTWQVRAERLSGDVSKDPNTGCSENEYITGFAREGAAGLTEKSILRVDDGATLDLDCVAEGSAPCGGLELDYTRGGGTITRFEPVANGVLRIENFPDGMKLGGYVLPLSFGSVREASNISSWRVTVNGDETWRRLGWSDGKICILHKGLMVIMR